MRTDEEKHFDEDNNKFTLSTIIGSKMFNTLLR